MYDMSVFLFMFLFQVQPCDFPQIKNGYLFDEERYRPYFPVRIGKWFYYQCNSGFVANPDKYWPTIECTVQGWNPAVPCVSK